MLKQKRIMYLLFIGFILFIGNAYGQENIEINNKVDDTRLVELEDGLYRVLINNSEGRLTQVGYYKEKINGKLVREGLWRMFDDKGRTMVTASFENNDLVWIKPKGEKKYTSEEIRLHRASQTLVKN